MTRLDERLLQCPDCRARGTPGSMRSTGSELCCSICNRAFSLADDVPVLLAADNPLFEAAAYSRAEVGERRRRKRRILPGPSVNLSRARLLSRLFSELGTGARRVLVVGAGTQVEAMLKLPAFRDDVTVTCIDIDAGADVDYFCDAHTLAFQDGAFSAVVTTAVLEHVLEPQRVVSEIHRVLAPGGLVYSELPFMQQVHEGAYDFSRYTLGGHRWLFRDFEEIDTGSVAGPGTALVWAIEHFAIAPWRSRVAQRCARGVARCLFFWLKYFDFAWADRPAAMDGASCTYFYGRKSASRLSEGELIARYTGDKVVQHV